MEEQSKIDKVVRKMMHQQKQFPGPGFHWEPVITDDDTDYLIGGADLFYEGDRIGENMTRMELIEKEIRYRIFMNLLIDTPLNGEIITNPDGKP